MSCQSFRLVHDIVSKLAIFERSEDIDAFGLRPNDLVPYVPGRQARWFPKTSWYTTLVGVDVQGVPLRAIGK